LGDQYCHARLHTPSQDNLDFNSDNLCKLFRLGDTYIYEATDGNLNFAVMNRDNFCQY
jgi:hypothetical protein